MQKMWDMSYSLERYVCLTCHLLKFKEKTLLEKCLESKLDEDMNLRKQCTKKQTECVTRDLWALFE